MLWFCRGFEVFPDGNEGYLLQMGNPHAVEWWACGRVAAREEVQESINTGLPSLEALARQEEDGIAELRKAVTRFEKWLPRE